MAVQAAVGARAHTSLDAVASQSAAVDQLHAPEDEALLVGRDALLVLRVGRAQQAAGKIHSDIERGFIRAEIVAYNDLMACGSFNGAKDKGLVRLEGKEYIMKDGDVTHFRFNV